MSEQADRLRPMLHGPFLVTVFPGHPSRPVVQETESLQVARALGRFQRLAQQFPRLFWAIRVVSYLGQRAKDSALDSNGANAPRMRQPLLEASACGRVFVLITQACAEVVQSPCELGFIAIFLEQLQRALEQLLALIQVPCHDFEPARSPEHLGAKTPTRLAKPSPSHPGASAGPP